MQIVTQRYLQRITNVQTWLDGESEELEPVPAYAGFVATLATQKTEIEKREAAFSAKSGGATQSVVLKSSLLDAVRHDISDIVRGAKVIELSQPGFAANFQSPASKGEESIIGTARVFLGHLEDAATLAAFTNIGMPADLKADLAADIQHFDDYDSQQASAEQGRIAELKALTDAIAASSRTIDALDAIVHFRFGNDKNKMSGWNQAKRLEKTRAHRKVAAPTA